MEVTGARRDWRVKEGGGTDLLGSVVDDAVRGLCLVWVQVRVTVFLVNVVRVVGHLGATGRGEVES